MSRGTALGAAAAALLAASCARVGPVSRPTPDGSGRVYSVAGLDFEVPGSWRAEGDPRKVKVSSPAGDALVEARATAVAGPAARCLEGAEEALERGAASLSDVRRHPSTFAGRKAVTQEADQGGWHGWAWATCDGGEQYRIFLSGRAPVSQETIEVHRRLVATARLGGTPVSRPAAGTPPELVRPYGDRRDDGVVQLSFVLPVEPGDRAREAATQVARKMGLDGVHVAAMEKAAEGYTFFVVYGRTDAAVDLAAIDVPEVKVKKLGFDELNALASREMGRRIVVLGACTGSDAHAVGIDAIMNMKGFAGDYGLERYPAFDARNLGSQVENAALARACRDAGADAVLVSQVVTQRDVHKENARAFLEELGRLGIRDRVLAILGGPRIDHRLALELGYDAGFGPGTRPSDVANYIVGRVLARAGKAPTEATDG